MDLEFSGGDDAESHRGSDSEGEESMSDARY